MLDTSTSAKVQIFSCVIKSLCRDLYFFPVKEYEKKQPRDKLCQIRVNHSTVCVFKCLYDVKELYEGRLKSLKFLAKHVPFIVIFFK